MDLISVIIPVYNVEKYLDRCVSSVLEQTYKNLDIILVDDGSPDNCPKMCDEYINKDSRIKVVHKENGGLGFARNSGLDVATGKYVTFVDSDDWIEKDHIENLHRVICENSADVVIGAHTSVDTSGNKTLQHLLLKEGVYEGDRITDEIVLPLIGPDVDFPNDIQITSSSCMNLYSMEHIKNCNLRFISEKYAVAEDLYFNIDFFSTCKKIVSFDETGYCYFENNASISRKYSPKRFERTLNFYKKINEQAKQYGITERISFRADRSFLMKIRVAIRLIVVSDLKRKEKKQEIRAILNNDVVRRVLSNYPVEKYIASMRALVKLMKKRNVNGVYTLMYYRESAKQNRFFTNILKKVGIGR